MEPVSPYLIKKHRVLPALAASFVLFALIRAVFFLDMEQVLTVMAGGAVGGFVLGLMMAGAQYLSGNKNDYWTICFASTAVFAVIGLIFGGLAII